MEQPPDSPPKEPKGRRKRSGSERRKRTTPFPLRLAPEERAAIEAAADEEGLSLGGYIRAHALPGAIAPTTRTRRRPSVDVLAIARLLGAVNKIGGNLHQLVRHLNFGGYPEAGEVRAALRGYEQVVAAIMAALGMGRP